VIVGRVEEVAPQVHQNLETLAWHRKRAILRALVRRVEIGLDQVQVVFRGDAFAGEADPEKKACNFVRGVRADPAKFEAESATNETHKLVARDAP
jgi:hypothetical protein